MSSQEENPIYQRYHGAGFSPSLVLIFTPTFLFALIGVTLNGSLIYVTIKCRATLKKPFNLLMLYDACWAFCYECSYLVRFFIPLLGINYISADVCFFLQIPAVCFAAQLVTMFFLAVERLFAILFPVWFANRKAGWMKFLSVLVIGFSMVHVCFINTLIYIGIHEEFVLEGTPEGVVKYREIMCNMADYSGSRDRFWAPLINRALQYMNVAIYALMWMIVLIKAVLRKQVSNRTNVQMLKSLSLIMAIICLGWVLQGFGPMYQSYWQLSKEVFFFYSVFLWINLIILASSSNAIVLFFISSQYRKCYQQKFPCLNCFSNGESTSGGVHVVEVQSTRNWVANAGHNWRLRPPAVLGCLNMRAGRQINTMQNTSSNGH